MRSNAIIDQIEKRIPGTALIPAPEYPGDPHAGLMTSQSQQAKYLFDENSRLTGLNLAGCGLDDAGWQGLLEDLGEQAANLTGLNLAGNALSRFTFGPGLENLQHVDLSGNERLEQIAFPQPLPRLEKLFLSECALQKIAFPGGFGRLQWLDLRANQLREISFAGEYPALEWLDLSGNKLTGLRLPKGLGRLAFLYLNDNQLENLAFDAPLRRLRLLHLRKNKLPALPDGLLSCTALETLYLHGNPWQGNLASAVPGGENANAFVPVRDYLRELYKGGIPKERVKIIIVGNGRVGKTSLFRRLKGLPFRTDEPFTHGVQLGELGKGNLPDAKTNGLQANVWDFGGQEIFYATHQFFLTDDALYVLAWTAEENVLPYRERDKGQLPADEKWRPREYWLESIRHHAPTSPILMVQTHCGQHRDKYNPLEYEQRPYNAECLEFDASNDEGLDRLRRLVTGRLNTAIPPFGENYPETYDRVIGAVEARQGENKIARTEFERLCREAGITPGGETSVLEFLRVTGTVVWFPQVAALQDTVFINPDWLTQQVYRLINNKLHETKGRLEPAYVENILPEYTPEERAQFLELLSSFELIFPAENEGPGMYIAPQYLPVELSYEGKIQLEKNKRRLAPAFTFHFPKFAPDNVIINFLSRYGPFSDKIYWRSGISFTSQNDTDCIVEFDEPARQLRVYTPAGSAGHALQAEVCRAFVELSKNANAEIALDGQPFVSWQELAAADKDGIDKIRATGGSPAEVSAYARFFEKTGMEEDKAKQAPVPKKPKVFISYAHKDEHFKDDMVTHLSSLVHQEIIETWNDRQIGAGFWDDQIRRAMEDADIFLLLITPNFLASEYISQEEITTAYRKFKTKKAKIFPIICDSCSWELQPVTKEEKQIHPVHEREMYVWLGKFQPFPKDGNPVTAWPNKNDAYKSIVESLIEEVI